MIGAQAFQMDNNSKGYEPDYGMDSYDDKQSYGKDNHSYKSKDSSASVKKIKCNNINVPAEGNNQVTKNNKTALVFVNNIVTFN